MGRVEVRDRSIWTRHIHGDPALARKLEALEPGRTVELRIDGHRGLWEKMRTGAHGLPTPGLKPLGQARREWSALFKNRRGELVEISLEGDAPASWQEATEVERSAAWDAFKALARAGWRSEGAQAHDRDALHDR